MEFNKRFMEKKKDQEESKSIVADDSARTVIQTSSVKFESYSKQNESSK